MGVTPGWGGAVQLVDLVGKREALKTLASSKRIHPTQALDMGLVDEIIPQDTADVQNAVCDWLLPHLKPPPAVIHATKKCVMGNMKPLEEFLEFERSIFKTMWSGEHNLKALEKNLKHSKS